MHTYRVDSSHRHLYFDPLLPPSRAKMVIDDKTTESHKRQSAHQSERPADAQTVNQLLQERYRDRRKRTSHYVTRRLGRCRCSVVLVD